MKKYKWLIVDFIVLSIIFTLSILIVVLGRWNWMWISIFFISSYIFNTIFVIFSVGNSDNEIEKMSWIFFMICIPYIGLVFYMLFKVRKSNGIKLNEYEKEMKEFYINKYENVEYESYIKNWQSKLVKRNFYKTKLSIFKNGYKAYEKLLEDIKNAKKYIHVEMYIIKESEIYEKLKNIFFQKVKEGVEIKIIFDKFGSWKVPIDEFKYLKSRGIELCFYNIPIYPYVRHTDNKRMHRKFFIIDGEIVHFGGLNITDEYCSFSKKYGYWADSNFSATGQIINDYQSCFLYDWYKITNKKLQKDNYISKLDEKKYNGEILNFRQGPNVRSSFLEDSLLNWINSSNKYIELVTPYFIPTNQIYKSLKNALRRGVKLTLFIPGKPDKKFTYKATLYYANKLLNYGANVYVLNNTFLHAKFGIFDKKFAYIGTNNLDMRSFYSNQEGINLLIGEKVINELSEMTKFYAELSIKKTYKNASYLKKIYNQFIFKLFAPLM